MGEKIVLGSSSPRRQSLLAELIGPDRFVVDPPVRFVERQCENLMCRDDARRFVEELAREKGAAVWQRRGDAVPVLSADTIVVAGPKDAPIVLGKPPETPDWQAAVREWWATLLSGRVHCVMTGVALTTEDGSGGQQVKSFVSRTDVKFREIDQELSDWYLQTAEPIGKAGGYAIQGLGSALVESVEGSLSSVIGLPLWETRQLLKNVLAEL